MEKRIKIKITALMIVIVTIPLAAYVVGQYWPPQPLLYPPVSLNVELTGYQHAAGEVMNVSFTLTNIAKGPILLVFPDSRKFDFSVKDVTGETIYVWSWGRGFYLMMLEEHLNPRESIQMTLRWTPNTTGWFTLTGYTVNFGIGWDEGPFNLTAQPILFEVIT